MALPDLETAVRSEHRSKSRRRAEVGISGFDTWSTVGLATATDREIWYFAESSGFTIVSKDADFHHMSFLYGPPPKTVWIRLGNCTTAKLSSFLTRKSETIRVFLHDEEAALLVPDEN